MASTRTIIEKHSEFHAVFKFLASTRNWKQSGRDGLKMQLVAS